MSTRLDNIDSSLATWLEAQHVFFVATAPLSHSGHVNCSPKGGNCFKVLDSQRVAYLDYTGSGAETIAHLRENGRIVLMFCAFDGKPTIVRLHGHGQVVLLDEDGFVELASNFPPDDGARSVIVIQVERVSTSCGFAVPLMDHRADRTALSKWATAKGPSALAEYRALKNARSIDGLPAV